MVVFITSDTHFGHPAVAALRGFASCEEHDARIIEAWNSRVTKHDVVWHLGDVVWTQRALPTLAKLRGIKKLIIGNHDTIATKKYLRYFNKVYQGVRKETALLTHVPIHPDCFEEKRRWTINIHGHLHEKEIEDTRYINICPEKQGYAPILLSSIIGD